MRNELNRTISETKECLTLTIRTLPDTANGLAADVDGLRRLVERKVDIWRGHDHYVTRGTDAVETI
jgi:hypothetical protein